MTKPRFLAAFAIALCASACGARGSRGTLPIETRNEVLSHYAHGESLDQIAREFRLADRDDARDAVHDAMITLTKRYYKDR